jgi:hypothetical protein
MKLHGTVASNLMAAVVSARRLRGQYVHADTVAHWQALWDFSKTAARNLPPGHAVHNLRNELAHELGARSAVILHDD